MKTLLINSENLINEASTVLSNGGVVIYPTETCYGIGVDATNPDAVAKIYKIKSRSFTNPISIAVTDISMAAKFVEINTVAKALYDKYTPGPITIISKSLGVVDPRLESADKTLGVRIPDHQLFLDIIKAFGNPVTSTSANKSGDANPYSIEDVISSIGPEGVELVDLMIDAGRLEENPPSTVVDTTGKDLKIVRQGSLVIS